MEIKINPGVSGMPKTTILEKRTDYIRSRAEYSNGLILLMEVSDSSVNVNPNFNLVQQPDGSFTPNFSSPNLQFVDEK